MQQKRFFSFFEVWKNNLVGLVGQCRIKVPRPDLYINFNLKIMSQYLQYQCQVVHQSQSLPQIFHLNLPIIMHALKQRTLTYFVRGSITVWLTSSLTGQDLAALLMLNQIEIYKFGQIQTSQTGGRLYSETSPYNVSECSLYKGCVKVRYKRDIYCWHQDEINVIMVQLRAQAQNTLLTL